MMPTVAVGVLAREMFTESEAARLLRLPQSTLRWWLEGGVRRNKPYKPVIRIEATGSKHVTWGEFVEAGLLRQYRRVEGVPLPELRRFIDEVREATGAPYPLAHKRPYVGEGRKLLLEAQESAALDADFCLVAVANGQTVLTPAAEAFFTRVEWSPATDEAMAWRPHDNPLSPVRIDPEMRYGLPAVRGIRTEILWEQVQAGADLDEVAADYDLDAADVRWAWTFEEEQRAA